MNEIFLWFWFADFVGNISAVGTFCFVMGLLVLFFGFLFEVNEEKELSKRLFKIAAWLVIPTSIAILVPEKNTIKIYAIVKAGQIAATETDLGKKSMQALEAVLDEIIQKKKGKK